MQLGFRSGDILETDRTDRQTHGQRQFRHNILSYCSRLNIAIIEEIKQFFKIGEDIR